MKLSDRILEAVRAADLRAFRSGRNSSFRLYVELMICYSEVSTLEREGRI